jgi:hypothetical protein
MGQPTNVQVEEHRRLDLRIMIGDTLTNYQIGPMDDVYVVLVSDSSNREMNPIKLSYTALMRLTEDYSG